MKPFDIKEYNDNPSRKVVTRDGRSVRILCTNARSSYPVIALIEEKDNKHDCLYTYFPDGTMCGTTKQNDLFFTPIKKEGWINLFRHVYSTEVSVIFKTEEEAAKNSDYGKNPRFIKTIHIEWEE